MAVRTLFFSAVFASACLSASHATQRNPKADPPPGMVFIEGGRTQIGTELKDIEKRILEEPEAQQRGNSLLSETPRNTEKIDPFFLMVNEVTNEQYEAFVRATGHKPPQHWASPEAEKAATTAHAEAEKARRDAAAAAGEKVERNSFDKQKWWASNWSTSEWSVPKGAEHLPVCYVSHADAKSYARWAGVRLMTEFEYTRAVRGDTERTFPWGDDFDVENAGTTERPERRSEPFPVGTFPGGAVDGVYDLAGNVWEWTDSPYTQFKGYKPLKLTIGRGKQKIPKTYEVAWDPDSRVCVGGSVQNGALAARATARRRLERIQTTDVVGFRCAANTRVGQDIAITILDEDLPRSVRPSNEDGKIEYRTELVLALDRWQTSGAVTAEGDAKDATATEKEEAAPIDATAPKSKGRTPPPGYAVIEDYDYIAFIPATAARSANQTSLRKETVDGQPLPLGVLSTTHAILAPELPAGTYMIGFRGQGERKERREPPPQTPDPNDPNQPAEPPPAELENEHAWETELGLDPAVDNYVVYDDKGKPIALIPCTDQDWSYTRMAPGTVGTVEVQVVEGEGKEQVKRMEKRLQFEVMLEGLTSSKGFRFTLQLRLDQDVLNESWRME